MKRILLVDDEPALLDVLREHFKGRYETDTALSGTAALERFAARRPDVVFLDISMPELNGMEVLKRMRQSDPDVVVVMVTATTDLAVTEACLKAGAFGYVPKPFNLLYIDHMAALATAHARPRRGVSATR
jgi:two-component system nitrogen regulation response regulator GlnG